jgi:glycosyltransferase involved in cell wall biosynthesis
VFPSRTETFGNVLLEAMASGIPVASVPAPGPVDLVEEGINGAIDDQLMRACLRAVRCSHEKARASILGRTLRAGHEVFRAHLVPLRADAGELFAPPRRAGLDAGLAEAAAAL